MLWPKPFVAIVHIYKGCVLYGMTVHVMMSMIYNDLSTLTNLSSYNLYTFDSFMFNVLY